MDGLGLGQGSDHRALQRGGLNEDVVGVEASRRELGLQERLVGVFLPELPFRGQRRVSLRLKDLRSAA